MAEFDKLDREHVQTVLTVRIEELRIPVYPKFRERFKLYKQQDCPGWGDTTQVSEAEQELEFMFRTLNLESEEVVDQLVIVNPFVNLVHRMRSEESDAQDDISYLHANTCSRTPRRPVIDQNFYYAGLKFTSPTFSCAMSNILPAMTFVLAVIFRMEKLDMKKVIYQAKVAGTLVTVAGAMLMTLYKGPIMEMVWTKHTHSDQANGAAAAPEVSDFLGYPWLEPHDRNL